MSKAIVFSLPTYYLFYSRYSTRYAKLSWFIAEFLPIFLIAWYFSAEPLVNIALAYLVARLAYLSLYEIGYIENDTKTIHHERKPTKRLSQGDYAFFSRHYNTIVVLKLCFALGLFLALTIVGRALDLHLNLLAFAVCLGLTAIVFCLHNHIRSRINILTLFLLLSLRYSAPVLLFLTNTRSWLAIGVVIVIFPLLSTLEQTTKEIYQLQLMVSLIGNIDSFRVKYYSLLSIAALALTVLQPTVAIWLPLTAILLCFLLYRLSCLYLVRRRGYRRFRRNKVSER